LISIAITGSLLLLVNRWKTIDDIEEKRPLRWVLSKLTKPLAVLILLILLRYFVEKQIGIIGGVWVVIKNILRFVFSLVAVWVVLIVGRGITEAFISSKRFKPEGIDANITRMVARLATLIVLMALLWNLSEFYGVSLTAVFASAGIAGMAIAFAARETLSNLFGGASILLDRPFKAGDYIILEGGERGKVIEVGLRSTRILTRDEIQISIPNNTITNTKIINESAPRPHFRIRLKVGVAYGSDIEQVKQLLLELAAQNKLVKQKPPPIVRMRGFGDSSLDFELLCWTRQAELKGRLISDLYRDIYAAFAAAGVVIPFPQRDVHFDAPSMRLLPATTWGPGNRLTIRLAGHLERR
jgi:MscS family membrane protein